LYEARSRRGLTTRAAAAEIGIKYPTVGRLERGDVHAENMTLATIGKIVRWLEEPAGVAR
jgi:transcriptional regulator with XRE-family HTH domain